ncbi:hypothetical protein ACFOWM_09365 [Ferruginibacter yonginensis]|uniref:Uncharacterized protein n=1 Tax=Ferruginibacter yonginensis TaxID=1310416 RepID=A0ABV8QSA6_9BACT
MKKLAVIFLLFVVALQCLPIKELGKCLYDNTFVEEEICKKGIDKSAIIDFTKLLSVTQFADHYFIDNDQTFFYTANTLLYPSPIKDIHTPPPNA